MKINPIVPLIVILPLATLVAHAQTQGIPVALPQSPYPLYHFVRSSAHVSKQIDI